MSTSQEIVVPTTGAAAMQLAFELGADFTPVGLNWRRVDQTYEEWETIGRSLGVVASGWQWAFGDWYIKGEVSFGEEAAQAIDGSGPATRMDALRNVLRKSVGTLQNIVGTCEKVPMERRRAELDFSHHVIVARLEPDEQVRWLAAAVENEWTVAELRDAIREELSPPEEPPEGRQEVMPPTRSRAEVLEEAAWRVYHQWQPTPDGSFIVPPEPAASLAAALGEER